MKPLNALLAIAGAATIGAACGMLFAPRKGSETRDYIRVFLKSHCPCTCNTHLNDLAAQIAAEVGDEVK
jgi:gas vesicle protein